MNERIYPCLSCSASCDKRPTCSCDAHGKGDQEDDQMNRVTQTATFFLGNDGGVERDLSCSESEGSAQSPLSSRTEDHTRPTHRQEHTNAKCRKASQERHQSPESWQGNRDHNTSRRYPRPRRHSAPSLSFLRLDVIRGSIVADHLDGESSGRDRITTFHGVLLVLERVFVLVIGCRGRWRDRVEAEHGFDREVELYR
jgi:hypothetical protein